MRAVYKSGVSATKKCSSIFDRGIYSIESIKQSNSMVSHRRIGSRSISSTSTIVVVIIVLWACSMDASEICQGVKDSLSATQYDLYNFSFNTMEYVDEVWEHINYNDKTEAVLDSICNITALHNLAKYVGNAEECSMGLLEEAACSWLYNTRAPNMTLCRSDLSTFCFRRMTWGQMNVLYIDFRTTINCQ